MFIEYINTKQKQKYIIEVWDSEEDDFTGFKEPREEDFYIRINDWCIEHIGYHARTAYNRFEFKHEKDLTLFLLKWA